MLRHFLAAALIAVDGTAMGQIVAATMDILTPGDPGAPSPAGVIVIDGFVDFAETDRWRAAGIRVTTFNGASMIYAPDADVNTPGDQIPLTNTGSTGNRFVSMVSRPHGRNGRARFDDFIVGIAGGYDPPLPGGDPGIATPTVLNVAWFDGSKPTFPNFVDGYVVRIAIDAPGWDANVPGTVTLGGPSPPPFGILLAAIEGVQDQSPTPGWVNATDDFPTPVGTNYYLWGIIPEPTALVLLALGALTLRRR